VAGQPVNGIVRIQERLDGTWLDIADVTMRSGRGTWIADVDSTRTYRALPVVNTTYPDVPTAGSAVRKIAARQVPSKFSAPIVSASSYFISEGAKVTFTAKWLYRGKRVTGKVRLQVNDSGNSWRTVARGATAKGKATFKVAVSASAKYRVVGVSTSSHKGRIRVGSTYASSPILFVSAKAKGGTPKDSFVIAGSGYGHGVGMSQYGAQAQALAGRSAEQILTYYYTGTRVTDNAIDQAIRIQIGTSSASPTVSFDDGGGTVAVDGTAVATIAAGEKVRLTAAGGSVVAERVDGAGAATALASAGEVALTTDGVMKVTGARGTYKRGSLQATVIAGAVNIVNRVGLNQAYLYGLAEVPSSWAPAALQAQAIAARNYAVVNSATFKPDCGCNLYDDTRSQVYTGWSKENEATFGAAWKAAVDATAGKLVVDSAGQPINAYYSSSSGGRTENSEDVWSAAVPYARSVDDPWSLDPASGNPNIAWTKTVDASTVAAAFGLPDVATLRVGERTAGGNAKVLEATSSSGSTARIVRAEEIRRVFELKSAHITGIQAS
jgi:SpoIID/LytB domain protein